MCSVRQRFVSNSVCDSSLIQGKIHPIITARKQFAKVVFTGAWRGGGRAWQGACMAGQGGHAWWGACVAGECAWHAHPLQILRDTVNERAVRILLECILVVMYNLLFLLQNVVLIGK